MSAPPFSRVKPAGLGRVSVAPKAPVSGAHRPNACVPPVVVTNGIGERVVYKIRSPKITPVVALD